MAGRIAGPRRLCGSGFAWRDNGARASRCARRRSASGGSLRSCCEPFVNPVDVSVVPDVFRDGVRNAVLCDAFLFCDVHHGGAGRQQSAIGSRAGLVSGKLEPTSSRLPRLVMMSRMWMSMVTTMKPSISMG